jgi:hypothetical protein
MQVASPVQHREVLHTTEMFLQGWVKFPIGGESPRLPHFTVRD